MTTQLHAHAAASRKTHARSFPTPAPALTGFLLPTIQKVEQSPRLNADFDGDGIPDGHLTVEYDAATGELTIFASTSPSEERPQYRIRMKKVRLTGVPIDETNYGASSSESVMGEAEGYVIETSERGETRISAGLTIYVLIMLNPEDPDELQFEFESKDGRISLRGLVPILR